MTTSQAVFGALLEQVAGQAFAAGGYRLVPDKVQQSGGLFRYEKASGQARLIVQFQVLSHADTPARFNVSLSRQGAGAHPAARVTLAGLLWDDFGVRLLSGPDHWWAGADTAALADALLEAGKLVFGYGIPWLEGALTPD